MARNLSKDELLAIIRAYRRESLGGEEGELQAERAEAMDRYLGRPYGNEMEGRSSVISRDLSDTVDWIMPSLMRVFTSTDRYVQFDPVGPEDEKQSEQESDYVNYVIMKDNQGWLIFHDWFKDSLLLKNGYVKCWRDETDKVSHETYSDLTEDELTLLLGELEAKGDKIEVVGQRAYQAVLDGLVLDMYEIRVRRTRKVGKITIEAVPPEELRISKRTRGSAKDSPFVEHITPKTRSELMEMGLSYDFVYSLPAYVDGDENAEKLARDTVTDHSIGDDSLDSAMEEVEYCEAYLRVDYDGDGIAELRKVITVGNQIPDGNEWNEEIDEIPFYDITPKRMPHRHVGLSIEDELSDLAEIKTALLRAMMDNTYGLVNHEYAINNQVVLEDFLTSRPYGVKRVDTDGPVGNAVMPIMKQPIIDKVLPVLDYVDMIKESRTGVGRNTNGLDADTLQESTKGAYITAVSQANQKVEMIARMFAETGVKDLALAVHSLSIKHQNEPRQIKLKNDWVTINPQEWRERKDMSVSVGLGTGSKDEVRANLLMIANLQERASQAGIVTPRNVYNLAERASDALGFKQQGLFFSDPESPEVKQMQAQQQGGENPLVTAEKIKAEYKATVDQLREEVKVQKDRADLMFEKYKFDREHALDIAKEEIAALVKGLTVDLGKPGVGTELNQTPTPGV